MSAVRKAVQPDPAHLSARTRDEISHLVAQRNALVDRLETGTRQIEQMRQAGEDVERWEAFWVRLLRQYETVCDRLALHESDVRMPRAS